uniref:Putative secreted protein n=1 Tax=Ixodes ricinus TaxID=34613 RepID=A0A6B0UDY1_IXORI
MLANLEHTLHSFRLLFCLESSLAFTHLLWNTGLGPWLARSVNHFPISDVRRAGLLGQQTGRILKLHFEAGFSDVGHVESVCRCLGVQCELSDVRKGRELRRTEREF